MIIAPFRVFQNITNDKDIESALACIKKHLSYNGIFIVNVFNSSNIKMDKSWCREEEDLDFEVTDEKTGIRLVKKIRRERIDIPNQIVYLNIVYEIMHTDGHTERVLEYFQLKNYYYDQLRAIVEKAGMKIIEVYSWYDKTPLGLKPSGERTGREIILVCRRKDT